MIFRINGQRTIEGVVTESPVFPLFLEMPFGRSFPNFDRDLNSRPHGSPEAHHDVLGNTDITAIWLDLAIIKPGPIRLLVVQEISDDRFHLRSMSLGIDRFQQHQIDTGFVVMISRRTILPHRVELAQHP